MSIITIGTDCIKSLQSGCDHVVHYNGKLAVWNIKLLRIRIFEFDHVRFALAPHLNFNKGENILERKDIRHFVINPIVSSQSAAAIERH